MYSFNYLAALALAPAATTLADRLAVIKTVATGSTGEGSNWCYDGAASYSINRESSHIRQLGRMGLGWR